MTRDFLPFLAAGLAVGLAACGSKGQAAPPKAGPSQALPLPADVQKLLPDPAPDAARSPGAASETTPGTLTATGEFVSPVRSELAAKLGGRVDRVFADLGARVGKGEPLLALETDYLKLELQRAEAEDERARAAEEEARRDLDRKNDLIAKGSVPQAVYDRSKSAFDQAQAAKLSADATLALARQRLADAVLRSPIDGVVLERRADIGMRLKDDSVAFVLVQTAPLKLRFRVPERYLSSVSPGQAVRATVDPYPEQVFEGRVAVVVQAVDPASRTFGVEAEFPNGDGHLRPGLFARVEMDLASPASGPGRGGSRAQAR